MEQARDIGGARLRARANAGHEQGRRVELSRLRTRNRRGHRHGLGLFSKVSAAAKGLQLRGRDFTASYAMTIPRLLPRAGV